VAGGDPGLGTLENKGFLGVRVKKGGKGIKGIRLLTVGGGGRWVRHEEERRKEEGGGRRRRRKEEEKEERRKQGGRRKGGGGGGRTSWRTATLPPRSTIFSELWKMMVPRKFNFNSRVKTVTNYSFFDICKLGSPKIRFCVFSMASSQEEDAQGDSQPKENSPAPDPYYLSSCCCEKHLRIVVGSQEAS